MCEFKHEDVRQALEDGAIDLALTVDTVLPPSENGRTDPRLQWEVCYESDVYLVTPRGHPLARRRQLRAKDLCSYPLVNAPESIRDRAVSALMEKFGLMSARSCRVEVRSVAAVRAYVQHGFGIGLICCRPPRVPHPNLHERNVSHLFGRSPIYLLRRKGIALSPAARGFVETVKQTLAVLRRSGR